jgi:hypothetical protein
MKLYFVTVKPRPNGVDYDDTTVVIKHFDNYEDNVNELVATINEYITDEQAIILNRVELMRFIDTISVHTDLSNKELFNKIRRRLRLEFDVCRIRFNPRTFVLYDRSFIINKRFEMKS